MKANDDLLLGYLAMVPSFIARIGYDEANVRNFWKTKLIKHDSNVLGIYSSMLNNHMIPNEEIEEANHLVVSKIREYTTDLGEHLTLQRANFGLAIEQLAFLSDNMDNYNWTNNRAGLLAGYVERYTLTAMVVKKLCEEFDSTYYSYWLAQRLERLFAANAAKKAEFTTIMNAENCPPPSRLPSLAT
jgi:hypothetical protein